MSGSPLVVLGGHATAHVPRLLDAVAAAVATIDRPVALVGGLAVAARIGRMERATADVDLVVHAPDDPPTVELVAQAGVARTGRSTVEFGGVKVDILDTHEVPPDMVATDGLDDHFVLAHRYAFESASLLRLTGPGGPEVEIAVAEPPALVAMKLHSVQTRHDAGRKVPGDLLDLFRLLSEFDREGALSRELRSVHLLNEACLRGARRVFDADLVRFARTLSASGDPVMAAVSRADLADIGALFIRRLEAAAG